MNFKYRKTFAAVSCSVLALSIAACGTDDEDTTDQEEVEVEVEEEDDEDLGTEDDNALEDEDGDNATEDEALEEDDALEDDEDDDAPEDEGDQDGGASTGGDETQVEIGETLEDPDMGDTIEILNAVRNFPSEERADLIEGGGEVVLVEVNVTPGDEFGGRISAGNFKISWDDGDDFWNNDTRMIEDEMEDAGYSPLEDISRIDGGEHTGWFAFFVDEESDTYLLEYDRPGAEVIGSDETIDEFVKIIDIPSA